MFPRRSRSSVLRWDEQYAARLGYGEPLARGDRESMTMTRLFVGNLSFEVAPVDLQATFAAYGQVSSADIAMDGSNGRSKGFGLIQMAWHRHVVAPIQVLNGS